MIYIIPHPQSYILDLKSQNLLFSVNSDLEIHL